MSSRAFALIASHGCPQGSSLFLLAFAVVSLEGAGP
jgi:hypothetical protein